MADQKERIKNCYDTKAGFYDWLARFGEWFGLRRKRRALLSSLRGRVLEVGIGSGINLPHYPAAVTLTGVDLSPVMLAIGKRRAERLNRAVDLRIMDVETLQFPNHSFDAVVSTLTLCTYPDPIRALREMARVLKPDGKILLLEHGVSNNRLLRWWQEKAAARHFRKHLCHLTRDPLALARAAGLTIKHQQRFGLGAIYLIELKPLNN